MNIDKDYPTSEFVENECSLPKASACFLWQMCFTNPDSVAIIKAEIERLQHKIELKKEEQKMELNPQFVDIISSKLKNQMEHL